MQKHCCKHTTSRHRDTCALGISYRSVTHNPDEPGSAFREACRGPDYWSSVNLRDKAAQEQRGTCPHYCEPTDDEIAAYEQEVAAMIQRTMRVSNVVSGIKRQHKGKSWSGIIECPICKGKLHVGIAGCNGHARVACETKDCVNYIE